MAREIITINIGNCGINLGDSIWRKYNDERDLQATTDQTFFDTTEKTIYPRTLLIDTEPHVVNHIISNNKSFYNQETNIFALKNHECNIFSRGYNKLGNIVMKDRIANKLQQLIESCDNLDGIILNRGISGGTGSGLGSLVLENFSVNYRKKTKVSCDIYPILRNLFSYSVVEPYNMMLALHWALDYTDLSFAFDNDSMYDSIYNKQPNYDDLNALISEHIALITSTFRYKSTSNINTNISEMITNMVPFPRLHFMFTSKEMDKSITNNEVILQNMLNKTSNFSIKCADYDAVEDKFMALSFHSRGSNYYNEQKALTSIVEECKLNQLYTSVEWCPTATQFAFPTPNTLNHVDETVLIGNNTCITRYFNDVITRKFDLLWHQRSYIHWFIRDGMEEGEFLEAREDVGFLEKDYLDVLSEQASDDAEDESEDCIGFSVGGGAKDINNFIHNVQQRRMPTLSSITYQGTFYQYLFDTKTNKRKCIDMHINDDEEKTEGTALFYPTYCYSKACVPPFLRKDDDDDKYEYYMTIGLNSTIKQSEFKRKKLNLLIILDKSGSMCCSFDGSWSQTDHAQSKMNIANKSVVSLLQHLNEEDRFGLVSFDTDAYIHQELHKMGNIKLETLKETIMAIRADNGTNFEVGFKKALTLYDKVLSVLTKSETETNDYENRIIILTDACPNSGMTDPGSLLHLVQRCAEDEDYLNGNRIYTTFIGVGLDFNNTLIEEISNVRGSNYYSVHSNIEFKLRMDEEFEYMVTPLVFNLHLSLKSEGNSCTVDNVYGCNESQLDVMINNGEIQSIKTLFPSKKNKGKGGTKGGIILIKLKLPKKSDSNDSNDAVNVEMEVGYEDRNGNVYKNNQFIILDGDNEEKQGNMMSDMIENDEEYDDSTSYYDNCGIHKGIVLSRYVTLIKEWIEEDGANNAYGERLYVSKKYKSLFASFKAYISSEMKILNDPTLQQECEILEILINS